MERRVWLGLGVGAICFTLGYLAAAPRLHAGDRPAVVVQKAIAPLPAVAAPTKTTSAPSPVAAPEIRVTEVSTPAAPAPEVKPQSEFTSAAPRALTESESLAREIKEGNLSGFVGSGTLVTGSPARMLRVMAKVEPTAAVAGDCQVTLVGPTAPAAAGTEAGEGAPAAPCGAGFAP